MDRSFCCRGRLVFILHNNGGDRINKQVFIMEKGLSDSINKLQQGTICKEHNFQQKEVEKVYIQKK